MSGDVDQLVDHRAHNPTVAGSSPVIATRGLFGLIIQTGQVCDLDLLPPKIPEASQLGFVRSDYKEKLRGYPKYILEPQSLI